MVNFITSILNANKLQDGTRRAVAEIIDPPREAFEASLNALTDTIRDVMRENDRVTKRPMNNGRKTNE